VRIDTGRFNEGGFNVATFNGYYLLTTDLAVRSVSETRFDAEMEEISVALSVEINASSRVGAEIDAAILLSSGSRSESRVGAGVDTCLIMSQIFNCESRADGLLDTSIDLSVRMDPRVYHSAYFILMLPQYAIGATLNASVDMALNMSVSLKCASRMSAGLTRFKYLKPARQVSRWTAVAGSRTAVGSRRVANG
jgi:hypothetical protein